ncbi:ABC transporter ATP-binding protein [Desulfovibrio psychrotolerans]|uniref:ABC transporter ATP-binding protein n=1 Tax=Desulfovibrio psychrotolerans TaxID=415242 RepID=A0A7J0BXG0_9BACT|nr:ABC transporter ATP-binding protein [Desulfovibrio psychrotolerans]GFM37875.1 ABC transporter ATP-binding protein [Desulfovibrio psychrotolerans]
MIHLKDICKTFVLGDSPLKVLKNINLEIHSGSLVSVVGRSGCGKSTLMNILGLLETPDSGTYLLNGQATSGLNDANASRIRNREIGFVFQQFHLLPRLTVFENIALPLVYGGVGEADRKEMVSAMLDRVDMLAWQNQLPSRLSGGQQQRVAVARALVAKPKLVLADEPTGALDQQTGQDIMSLFLRLNREERTTLVIITHDPAVAGTCDIRFRMQDGVIEPA